MFSKLELFKDLKLENIIDIEEESIVFGDIDDETIIEMIKESPNKLANDEIDDIKVNDIKPKITLENVTNALKNVNEALIILKSDNIASKEIFKSLSTVQNYLYKRKQKFAENQSMLKWLIKREK